MTEHPSTEWTIQQFREFLPFDHPYRFVVHDRDGILSPRLDQELNGFGVRVLKTPVGAPQANAFCERLVGTIRRECLDFLIPLNKRHISQALHLLSGRFGSNLFFGPQLENWDLLDRLSFELFERGELNQAEIAEILNGSQQASTGTAGIVRSRPVSS